MDLGFTWFDFAALAILGLSGVMAFARGLIREVFSVIAFIAAGIAAIAFARVLSPFVEQYTPLSSVLAPLAAGLLIFLAVFIAITLVTSTIAKTAHQSTEIGSFDRAAGLAFGILRGVLVVALPLLLLQRQEPSDHLPPPASSAACQAAFDELRAPVFCARTYFIYGRTAAALGTILPDIGSRITDAYEKQRGELAPIPSASGTNAPEPENLPAKQN